MSTVPSGSKHASQQKERSVLTHGGLWSASAPASLPLPLRSDHGSRLLQRKRPAADSAPAQSLHLRSLLALSSKVAALEGACAKCGEKWMHHFHQTTATSKRRCAQAKGPVPLRWGALQGLSVSAGTAGVLAAVRPLARRQCHSQSQASTILARTTAAADTRRSGASRRMATKS